LPSDTSLRGWTRAGKPWPGGLRFTLPCSLASSSSGSRSLLRLGWVISSLFLASALQANPPVEIAISTEISPPELIESEKSMAADRVLEQVRFILYGNERNEVAEVQLDQDQYLLTLFNETLASHYSVRISREELISSEPILADRTERILSEREVTIAARERLRVERRELRRLKDQDLTTGHRSGSTSGSRNGSSTSKEVGESTNSSLASPISPKVSASQSIQILKNFLLVTEELRHRTDQMRVTSAGCEIQLTEWNRASDRGTALYSRLREETYHLIEQEEFLAKKIQSRSQEINRSLADVEAGEIRSGDFAEVIDRIRRRLLLIEQKLDSIEAQLSACSDGIQALGDPIVLASPTAEPSDITARPEHATVRPEVSMTRTATDTSQRSSAKDRVIPAVSRRKSDPEEPRNSPRRQGGSGGNESDEGSVSPSRGDQQQDQVNDDLDVSSGSGTAGKEDMTRTLMIGGILGALFALVLAHLIKRLGPA
jgi:hypothetical protein